MSEPDHDCGQESGVVFDEEEAKRLEALGTLDTYEIRKRWPRKSCPKCNTVCYASYAHYIWGDW